VTSFKTIVGLGLLLLAAGCVSYEQRVTNECQRLGMVGAAEMQQCARTIMAQDNAPNTASASNPIWGQMINTGTQMMIQPQRSPTPMCFTNPTGNGGFSTYCQ
jgi:hypothetical protein